MRSEVTGDFGQLADVSFKQKQKRVYDGSHKDDLNDPVGCQEDTQPGIAGERRLTTQISNTVNHG